MPRCSRPCCSPPSNYTGAWARVGLKMAGGEGLEPSQPLGRQNQNLVRLSNFAIPLKIVRKNALGCPGGIEPLVLRVTGRYSWPLNYGHPKTLSCFGHTGG